MEINYMHTGAHAWQQCIEVNEINFLSFTKSIFSHISQIETK